MNVDKFALSVAIMFGVTMILGNLYNAAQEPIVITINQNSDYNTSYKKIDISDLGCPYGEEVIGRPIKVLIRRGELTDEITFKDNFVFKLPFADRIDWANYSNKIVKVRAECGSLKTVELK